MGEAVSEEPYLRAKVTPFPDAPTDWSDAEKEALQQSLQEMSMDVIQHSPNLPSEAAIAIKNIDSLRFLVHFIAANMNAEKEQKQSLLEVEGLKERVEKVMELLGEELQVLELKNDIQSRVKTDIEKQQREFFLHQQMKQIQEELGSDPHKEDIAGKKARAELKDWPEKVAETFAKEIGKLEQHEHPERRVQRAVQLPGPPARPALEHHLRGQLRPRPRPGDPRRGPLRIGEGQGAHHRTPRRPQIEGRHEVPIICLYGPPGVGKTSLGKSIAKALGREYVRVSLSAAFGTKPKSAATGRPISARCRDASFKT